MFMASIHEKFGKQLGKLRRQKEMTQEELALKAGVDLTTISNIEVGNRNPSLKTIYSISRGLRVSLKELFDF